jgi:predicted nucleic acid-binding protein
MRIAVSDANIFIDLLEVEAVAHLFSLDMEVHTTDRVLLELYPEQEQELLKYHTRGDLILHQITDDDKAAINAANYNPGLSDADKSVLFLAGRVEAMVLTGDDLVRKNCHQSAIEIHGILWLLDQFVEQGILETSQVHRLLERLMTINTRLPVEHCTTRLNKWKTE